MLRNAFASMRTPSARVSSAVHPRLAVLWWSAVVFGLMALAPVASHAQSGQTSGSACVPAAPISIDQIRRLAGLTNISDRNAIVTCPILKYNPGRQQVGRLRFVFVTLDDDDRSAACSLRTLSGITDPLQDLVPRARPRVLELGVSTPILEFEPREIFEVNCVLGPGDRIMDYAWGFFP